MDERYDKKETSQPDEITAENTYIKPQARKLYDPDVTFEEYYHYAQKTRREEERLDAPKLEWRELISRKAPSQNAEGEKITIDPNLNLANRENRLLISDEEWTNASRSFRTASAGAIFYLITTDILGPFATPYAIGTLGYGPGIALFIVFGFMAGYSGYLVWRVFLGVDSYEFPARNYGDLAFRVLGTPARHVTNFIQALALLLLLGSVTILFGLNISQMSKFRLCYIVCPLIFAATGCFLSQIRTLRNYGWVANLAVWLNLLVIFLTMGVMAHSPPNFAISTLGSAGGSVDPSSIKPDADGTYPAIVHYSGLPSSNIIGSVNGLLSGSVLAYAGLQLFVEFLAEMRRPRDFLKVMWGAQLFILTVYVVYGCYVYYFQGQYTFNPSYQGVSTYAWQTAGNAITLIAGLISGGLYGNIGVKVFYNNVLMDMLGAPMLNTKRGNYLYAAIVPVWWATAFIIAAAIPDFFGFNAVISASTLLNLTYTLPPLIALGFDINKNAMRIGAGDGFDPVSGQVTRSGSTIQRLTRGFFAGGPGQIAVNLWHVVYFLASFTMCVLGMYASVSGLTEAFKDTQLNAFSCRSPLNLGE